MYWLCVTVTDARKTCENIFLEIFRSYILIELVDEILKYL